jgi:feruloyl-CoA synthase
MQRHPVREARVGGSVTATIELAADGSATLRSTEPLADFPARITDRLEHWASRHPDRSFVARRGASGEWQNVSYGAMVANAQAIGAALLQRGLSVERPVMILSGNGLEHLMLAMGALWAGIPHIPVSVAYSLLSTDFAKLRHIVALTTPGLVFADSPAYARAIAAVLPADCEVVLAQGELPGRAATAFAELLRSAPTDELAAAHREVGPDTIAKILFTSGSTAMPKGVVNTHRMWCASQQMLSQCMAFLNDEPPLIVDWLPWNHTFGGNHNVGITLYHGGTLYIDDGKPIAGAIEATLRNLRELSPTIYFNVPKGFEEIALAMDREPALRDSLFRHLNAFMFAGAGLSQAVWDRIDGHAVAATGARVRFITGIGMTETGPSGTLAVGPDARSGEIGLPEPGLTLKLVPCAGKTELRIKGPTVFPGYWRAPAQTAAVFDDDGYYRTGDAVCFIDPAHPEQGLRFDGRIAEDFKLSTGTFVSVGPLRARVILEGDPLVHDVVIAGIDRDEVGLLVFPRVDDCRRLAGVPATAPILEVLGHIKVREAFQQLLDRLWAEGSGSASRPARLLLLAEPPSLDGEQTDKGSVNQRSVLARRTADVDRLYAALRGDHEVLFASSAFDPAAKVATFHTEGQ